MDCSPPGSSVHGILQALILEWVAMPSSRDQTCLLHLQHWQACSLPPAPPGKPNYWNKYKQNWSSFLFQSQISYWLLGAFCDSGGIYSSVFRVSVVYSCLTIDHTSWGTLGRNTLQSLWAERFIHTGPDFSDDIFDLTCCHHRKILVGVGGEN